MQNLIIDEITIAVWNEFTAKTHNEKRDYQYSVNKCIFKREIREI